MSDLAVPLLNGSLDSQTNRMVYAKKRLLRRGNTSRSHLLRNLCRWWSFALAAGALLVVMLEVGNLSTMESLGLPFLSGKGLDKKLPLLSKASSFMKKEKSSHLGDLTMPMRRASGVTEPCLKLLSEEEIVNLQLPPYSESSNLNVRYRHALIDNHKQGSDRMKRVSSFDGNQTMAERADSFKVHANNEVHCGFFGENSGFDIEDDDKYFMSSCEVVVVTCIFGGGDVLYEPIGMANASLVKVCYVAFVDSTTLATMEDGRFDHGTHKLDLWRIVIVHNLPFSDQRRNGKIPKMLVHRLFPKARYSIWVDSKYQFRRDPMAVLEALLWEKKAMLAISEHGGRSCVYKEGEAVIKKHKALPKEVALQLDQYHSEGFEENAKFDGHKALAEASVITREHNPLTNLFMCLWFNEVIRFTARDQLSFPYVLCRFKLLHVNMFPICTRRALVNALGHKHKVKQLE